MVCRAIRRTAQSRAARRTPAARVGLHQTLATSRETIHTIPKCSGTHAPNPTHDKTWPKSGDVRPPQLPRHRATRCRAPRASSCPEGGPPKRAGARPRHRRRSEANSRCASLTALASRCLPHSAPGKSSRELEGGKNTLNPATEAERLAGLILQPEACSLQRARSPRGEEERLVGCCRTTPEGGCKSRGGGPRQNLHGGELGGKG